MRSLMAGAVVMNGASGATYAAAVKQMTCRLGRRWTLAGQAPSSIATDLAYNCRLASRANGRQMLSSELLQFCNTMGTISFRGQHTTDNQTI
ncbi:hypothetical protein FQZ97_626700 [compost metagenome]